MREQQYLKNIVTLKMDREKCRGCGLCEVVCPHNVFKMSGDKASIVNIDSCMECGACARNCPVTAISVRPGVGCAFHVIHGILSGKKIAH